MIPFVHNYIGTANIYLSGNNDFRYKLDTAPQEYYNLKGDLNNEPIPCEIGSFIFFHCLILKRKFHTPALAYIVHKAQNRDTVLGSENIAMGLPCFDRSCYLMDLVFKSIYVRR